MNCFVYTHEALASVFIICYNGYVFDKCKKTFFEKIHITFWGG